ncbi:DUF6090 family protein [Winogradskyella flava]|uniref:DUF6090 family protein n=1 Tax=Winogradskyella flava TaxID=1884876 RepID=UPI0024929801|nr:DUF6090 family protein [Winogradskyella flava]
MIKFFRKIRQNLLSEGKTGKYFKYAIGEIILVVIGILIALSINNWNQNITYKNELQQILKEVQIDLNKDLLRLNSDISYAKKFKNYVDNVLNNGNTMTSDSLLKAIRKVHGIQSFVAKDIGYNKMVNHPRTDILSDSLTTNLTYYYYNYGSQSKISDTRKETLSGYSMNKLRDYLIEYGFPIENKQAGIKGLNDSLSLKRMINDIKFIGILRNAKWNRNVQLSGFIRARKTVEQNLDIIDSYLTNSD